MTGWRIGYLAGPEDLVAAMRKVQGQSTSCAGSVSQAAAVAALNGPQDCVEQMRNEFKRRYEYIHAALNDIPGVECPDCDGAFYAFPTRTCLLDVRRSRRFHRARLGLWRTRAPQVVLRCKHGLPRRGNIPDQESCNGAIGARPTDFSYTNQKVFPLQHPRYSLTLNRYEIPRLANTKGVHGYRTHGHFIHHSHFAQPGRSGIPGLFFQAAHERINQRTAQ